MLNNKKYFKKIYINKKNFCSFFLINPNLKKSYEKSNSKE